MSNPYVAAIGLALDIGTKLANGRTDEAFDSLNPFASASSEPLSFEIPPGGIVVLAHKLGRVPNGRQVICQIGPGTLWETEEPDDKYFYFQGSDANTVFKILVS